MGILVDAYHWFTRSDLWVILSTWKCVHPSLRGAERELFFSQHTHPTFLNRRRNESRGFSIWKRRHPGERRPCTNQKRIDRGFDISASAFRGRLTPYLIGGNTFSAKHSPGPSSSLQKSQSCRSWGFTWRLSMGYFTVRLVHGLIVDIFTTLIV